MALKRGLRTKITNMGYNHSQDFLRILWVEKWAGSSEFTCCHNLYLPVDDQTGGQKARTDAHPNPFQGITKHCVREGSSSKLLAYRTHNEMSQGLQ